MMSLSTKSTAWMEANMESLRGVKNPSIQNVNKLQNQIQSR